ncbi:hypothetical protein ACLX1H_011013 [Fusarium chlamydosporum]
MVTKHTLLVCLSILASAVSAVHLDCALDPDAQCDPAQYCTFTWNNGDCASTGWGQDDKVPTFAECVFDIGCPDKCVNGLCCDTSKLPNGEADCPTLETITNCCYVRTPGPGGIGSYAPVVGTRPPELSL